MVRIQLRKVAAESTPAHKEKQVGGAHNGAKRLVPSNKAPKFYSAEDVCRPKVTRKVHKPTKLRSSITPGTILILLAGPFKINGVPLRRVNQAYVISTSTRVYLGDLKVEEKINDSYFAKAANKSKPSAEQEFFEDGKPKAKEALSEAKTSDQKEVDKHVIAALKKTENLAKYMKSSFGLLKGQFPHQLKF